MIDKNFQSPTPFFFASLYYNDVFFGCVLWHFLKIEMATQCINMHRQLTAMISHFFV